LQKDAGIKKAGRT